MARASARSGFAPALARRASSRAMRGVSYSSCASSRWSSALSMRSPAGGSARSSQTAPSCDARGIDAQVVAAVDRRARLQVEFPVVPMARQHAVGVERAFHQRIALVRATVVAREDLAVVDEERDVPAVELYRDRARRREAIDAGRAGPACDGGRRRIVRHEGCREMLAATWASRPSRASAPRRSARASSWRPRSRGS